MSEPVRVAAALILREGRFLICRRPMHKARGGLWEFPGGKLEPGESAEQALIRECREELAVTLRVGELFTEVTHEYPDLTVHLSLFHAFIAAGEPQLLEHVDLKWITPDEIPLYEFCPADEEILRQIRDEAAVKAVLKAYGLPGRLLRAESYGNGHVNDTRLLSWLAEQVQGLTPQAADADPAQPAAPLRLILQRLSREAFPQPEAVMENFVRITDFLRDRIREAGGDPAREVLSLIPLRDGRRWYTDADGSVWRLTPFIEGSCQIGEISPEMTPAAAECAAKAYGRFLSLSEAFPAALLREVIPAFHDTAARLAAFGAALAADPLGRAASLTDEVRFIREREADYAAASDALRRGPLPLRAVHNDAKPDNLLFDRLSGGPLCVTDLDTVMPGFACFDFGDLVRSVLSRAGGAGKDAPRFDLSLFKACVRGFLQGADGSLTKGEILSLPLGVRLITLELGVRYLTDYLAGDRYFKVSYPSQNLERARRQLLLLQSLEASAAAMEECVRACAGEPNA
jgi:mutator protein MutT